MKQYLTVALGVLLVVVAASMANITVLIYYIIPTIESIYNPSYENSDLIYCKLRLYIRNALLVISRTYSILACVTWYAFGLLFLFIFLCSQVFRMENV